jgi:(2Fe-2S) ferredoxin
MKMKFEKHIFICTNQRAAGEKKSCGEACGMELVKEFKKQLKDQNLKGRMRAQRAGCLDACEFGPSLVIYPEGVYYGGVKPEHVHEIIHEHLINNRVVKHLLIDFNEQLT